MEEIITLFLLKLGQSILGFQKFEITLKYVNHFRCSNSLKNIYPQIKKHYLNL